MNIPYMIRRLTFSFELKGFFTKIDYFIKELISLSTRISPVGPQKVIWNGPKGNIVLNFYDSLVCWRDEILDQHLYDIELKSKTPTILDIGANQGFFTLWMKYNYPGAIIHAFEPCKQSANMIISNVVDNNFQDVFIHNVGISDKNKIAYLNHIGGGAGLGDTVVNNSSMGNEKITLINLDPLLKRFKNFDLIKIDIEGSEFPVLDNCSFWKKADKIIIEFHDNVKAKLGDPNKDYLKVITDAGFKLDKKVGEGAVYVYYFSKK